MAKESVKVFLDSNVILSGLISDKGAPRIILDILSLALPGLSCMTGSYNITEIERNLEKKMPDALQVYRKYLPMINLEIIPMPSPAEIKKISGFIADKDAPVLASALKGNADFLVTGDKKDFAKPKLHGGLPLKIVSPSEFLDVIVQEILRESE